MEPTTKNPTYPELERMNAISKESQTCGEFLVWLREEKKFTLCQTVTSSNWAYHPVHVDMTKLLAEFFRIDLNKVEEERRVILDSIRQSNDGV